MTKKITIIKTYGGSKKSAADMTDEEFKEAAQKSMERVRYNAFSHGSPIYYGKNGKIIAEYADGRKEVVKE
jgi:hypothetical protein